MHNDQEERTEAIINMSMQFLAEAIGQCPAGLEQSTNQDIVFAVTGFQYGAVMSAAHAAGVDTGSASQLAEEVLGRINGMDRETARRFVDVMPMLAGKEYPPISIGGRAILGFYHAPDDEARLGAAGSLQEILRQIDAALFDGAE